MREATATLIGSDPEFPPSMHTCTFPTDHSVGQSNTKQETIMSERSMSERRKQLLLELEEIVGNEGYNANTQNFGPGGRFEGWGREFRYPVRFIDEDGERLERRIPDLDLPEKIAKTGHYAFGANQLHIIRALDKVLAHLEQHYGLIVPR